MSKHIYRPDVEWHGHYYPRRYWNLFMTGSLITHLLVIALFYNASLFSLVDLAKKKTEQPQTLYVGLVEPEKPKPAAPETVQAEPRPSVAPAKSTVRAREVKAEAPPATRGEPVRSPSASKEEVSEEELEKAMPVPADKGEGVTVAIKGAEKASSAATAQPSVPRVGKQTRASTPGTSKSVAKADRRSDEGRQEFSQYSTAGKRLDVPESQYAKKAAPEPGDDPSAKWFQPKSLNAGGGKLQTGAETGPAGKGQPKITTVAKSGQVAGATAGEAGTAAASLPGGGKSGPAATAPPRLAREVYGPSPRPGRPGAAQTSAEAVPSGIGRGTGAEKQLALARTGSGSGASGMVSSEPRIGPKALAEVSRPAPAPPSVTITSPADKSEIDAMKERVVTITGEVRGSGVSSVRVHLNSGVYEAPVSGGRFTLRARMDTEDNVLFAEVTDDSGSTAKSGLVKFKALNLFPKDMVIKVEYKGEGAHPALDCRFKLHPLYDKRRLGSVPPNFHIEDGSARGKIEVMSAVPGIYTIGARCAPGAAVEAVFEVTLYGYDQGRKKVRKIGPVKLADGGRVAPSVRILMPECVFWEDNDWFTGCIEGGNGTIKYKEPDGLVWKEQEH